VTKIQNKLVASKVDLASISAKIAEEDQYVVKLQASIQAAESDMEGFQVKAEGLKDTLAAAVAAEKHAVQTAAQAATLQAGLAASGPLQLTQKLQEALASAKEEAAKLQAAKGKAAQRAEHHLTAAARLEQQLQAAEVRKKQLLDAQAEHEQLQLQVDALAHGELEAATETWRSAQTHYMVLQVSAMSGVQNKTYLFELETQ
jgi:chromosome segregation ATPase